MMVFTPEIKEYHLVEELIRDANDEKFQVKLEKEYFVKHWENRQHNTEAEKMRLIERTHVKTPLLDYQQQSEQDQDWLLYKIVFVVTFTSAVLCVGRDRKTAIMSEEKEEEQQLSQQI